MGSNPQRDPVLLIDDLETLRLITDPLRFQIMQVLDPEPMTINAVAEKMGLSASRLYYHFNLMEEHDILQVVETHTVNNIIEKVYWLTAEDIQINNELINFSSEQGAENIARVITSYFDGARDDILRSLQARKFNLAHGAEPDPHELVMIQHKKRLTDEVYDAFTAKLRAIIEEFQQLDEALPEDEGHVFSLVCSLYPSYYFEQNEANEN